jgi:hypothetical protein
VPLPVEGSDVSISPRPDLRIKIDESGIYFSLHLIQANDSSSFGWLRVRKSLSVSYTGVKSGLRLTDFDQNPIESRIT